MRALTMNGARPRRREQPAGHQNEPDTATRRCPGAAGATAAVVRHQVGVERPVRRQERVIAGVGEHQDAGIDREAPGSRAGQHTDGDHREDDDHGEADEQRHPVAHPAGVPVRPGAHQRGHEDPEEPLAADEDAHQHRPGRLGHEHRQVGGDDRDHQGHAHRRHPEQHQEPRAGRRCVVGGVTGRHGPVSTRPSRNPGDARTSPSLASAPMHDDEQVATAVQVARLVAAQLPPVGAPPRRRGGRGRHRPSAVRLGGDLGPGRRGRRGPPTRRSLPPAGERERFRDAVGYDDATWRRAAGWALAPALTGIPYYRETVPAFAERGRRTIGHVLASLP